MKNYLKNLETDLFATEEPTRIGRNRNEDGILDMAPTKNVVTTIKRIVDLVSDHLPVEIMIHSNMKISLSRNQYEYNKADWAKFKQELNRRTVINKNISSKEEIDNQIKKFVNGIKDIKEVCIPKHTTNSKQKNNRGNQECNSQKKQDNTGVPKE